MTARGGGWVAATASVRGASHERTGKPNQDAVRVVEVGGAGGGLVAAVCDGHGGDRYVRSDVGSRFGVEVACTVGRRLLTTSIAAHDVEERLRSFVVPEIVERWRGRVLDDVAARPFTSDEERRAGAALDGDPLVSYGATLLLAILGRDWVGFVQIGDGDITIVSGEVASSPVPHDDRLVGSETTSLCLPTAVADARVAVCTGRLPDLVVLSSDGYANSFASPTWRNDVGRDLFDLVGRRGIDDVEAQLPEWLADSAAAAGDDVSMALLHRPEVLATSTAGAAPRVAASPPTSTSTPDVGGGRRLRGAAYVAGAAALVGLTAGFLVGRSSGGDGAGAGESPVGTTSAVTSSVPDVSIVAMPPVSSGADGAVPAETVPSTTDADPPPLELVEGDQVLLFSGGDQGAGVVLALDPSTPSDPRARLVAWVDTTSSELELPTDWELEDALLAHRGTPVAVVFAVSSQWMSPYVWAVAPDQRTLTAYDATTGRLVATTVIRDAAGNALTAVIAPPSDRPSTTPAGPATSTTSPNTPPSTPTSQHESEARDAAPSSPIGEGS